VLLLSPGCGSSGGGDSEPLTGASPFPIPVVLPSPLISPTPIPSPSVSPSPTVSPSPGVTPTPSPTPIPFPSPSPTPTPGAGNGLANLTFSNSSNTDANLGALSTNLQLLSTSGTGTLLIPVHKGIGVIAQTQTGSVLRGVSVSVSYLDGNVVPTTVTDLVPPSTTYSTNTAAVVTYVEQADVSNPNGTQRSWVATSGTVQVTAVSGTHAHLILQNVAFTPYSASQVPNNGQTGTFTVSGEIDCNTAP
jgi:hypothetical protein